MNFAFFPASIFIVAKYSVRLRNVERKRIIMPFRIFFFISVCEYKREVKGESPPIFFKPISRLIIDRAIFVRFCSSAPIPLSSQMEKEKVHVCLSRRGIRGDLYSFGQSGVPFDI